jgi:hypothetical protein
MALINNNNGEMNSLSLNYVEDRWQRKQETWSDIKLEFQYLPAPT